MTTLTTSPTADVLEQLFADAERSQEAFRERMAQSSGEWAAAWQQDGYDWRDFFTEFKDTHLAVSRQVGDLLYLLARSRGARTIVEFGTSFGISTIFLAAAVRDTGDGRVISTEFEPSKVANARRGLDAAELGELVEIREGDATETLAREIAEPIDLVFLDGAKNLYVPVLQLLEPRMSPNAVLVADNAGHAPEYVDYVRSDDRYISTPGDGDVEISLHLAGGTRGN